MAEQTGHETAKMGESGRKLRRQPEPMTNYEKTKDQKD